MQSNWSDWKNRFQALGTTELVLNYVAKDCKEPNNISKNPGPVSGCCRNRAGIMRTEGQVSQKVHGQSQKSRSTQEGWASQGLKKFISPVWTPITGKTEGHWRNSNSSCQVNEMRFRVTCFLAGDLPFAISWWANNLPQSPCTELGPQVGATPSAGPGDRTTRDHRDQGTGQLQRLEMRAPAEVRETWWGRQFLT